VSAMSWRATVIAFFLLNTSLVFAHEAVPFDTRRATPGLEIELNEIPSTASAASPTVRYRVRASGLPRDLVFGIWARDFGHGFHEVATGLRMVESGGLVSGGPDAPGRPEGRDELIIEPGPYPYGAVWEVALASADLTLTAFTKVIPYPLRGQDGLCTVSLELASRRGERFVASGSGFVPGETIVTDLRYAGQTVQKTFRASPGGSLPTNVISHGGSSNDSRARYTAKGRSCEVTVDYEWGEPALSRR
jgi:hypothetical protein